MRHLLTSRFWRQSGWRITVPAIVLGAVIAVAVTLRARDTAALDSRICAQIDKLAQVQIDALDQQLITLPAIYYYQVNPGELPGAITQIRRQKAALQSATC